MVKKLMIPAEEIQTKLRVGFWFSPYSPLDHDFLLQIIGKLEIGSVGEANHFCASSDNLWSGTSLACD